MGETVNGFVAWLSVNQEVAGPALGALCLFLCLGIVGIIITAPPVLLAVGGLIAAGSLNAFAMIGWAALGGIIGYFITYYAGRWLGPGVVHRWPLKNYRRAVARSRLLFRRYASLAVFFSRFFGPLRCTIPLIAGITGMNQRRYMIANALSAPVWAVTFMAPGWIAVRGMAELESLGEAHWLSITAAGLVLAGVIVALGFKVQRARLERQRLHKRRIAARRSA